MENTYTKRAYAVWSEQEDSWLMFNFNLGRPVEFCAKQLQRSENAIVMRLDKLRHKRMCGTDNSDIIINRKNYSEILRNVRYMLQYKIMIMGELSK